MNGLGRALVALAVLSTPVAAHAQTGAAKPAISPAKAVKASAKPVKPAPAATSSAPPKKEDAPAQSSEAAAQSDAPLNPAAPSPASTDNAAPESSSDDTAPAAPLEKPTVHVYLRSGIEPILFSARAASSDGTPTLCTAPCELKLLPGDYRLRLNGVPVEGNVALTRPGTLEGKFESREAGREGAWLALNVGGILGGVFVTIAALGGPSWTYIAGGGSLLSGGVIFVLTYRSDRATVSFAPADPRDIRGLPPPLPTDTNSSGPLHGALWDRPRFGDAGRSLGFRIAF